MMISTGTTQAKRRNTGASARVTRQNLSISIAQSHRHMMGAFPKRLRQFILLIGQQQGWNRLAPGPTVGQLVSKTHLPCAAVVRIEARRITFADPCVSAINGQLQAAVHLALTLLHRADSACNTGARVEAQHVQDVGRLEPRFQQRAAG